MHASCKRNRTDFPRQKHCRGVFLTLFHRVAGTLRGFFRKLLLPVALMRDQSGHQGGQDMTSLRSVPSRDLACMPKWAHFDCSTTIASQAEAAHLGNYFRSDIVVAICVCSVCKGLDLARKPLKEAALFILCLPPLPRFFLTFRKSDIDTDADRLHSSFREKSIATLN